MKLPTLILFLSIVFSIYGFGNYFIYSKGLHLLPQNEPLKITYRILFILVSLSFIISRFLGKTDFTTLFQITDWIGSIWLFSLLYFFLIIIGVELILLINKFVHFLPQSLSMPSPQIKTITFIAAISIVSIIIAGGLINQHNPKTTFLKLPIHKKVENYKNLRIVAASDIHFGIFLGKERLQKMVNDILQLKPDIVVLAGDIVSEDIKAVLKMNIGEPLKDLKAPLGIFAITGNHEYIGGIEESAKYLESLNIVLLRDTSILLNNSIYLIGREDREKTRYNGIPRKKIDELLQNLDKNKPKIVLDHQPYQLKEIAKTGIDLQISGHTHHGQLWPFNFITSAIFELSQGYLQIDNSHFYVSSGYGVWAAPVRTSSRPELVVIDLIFD